MMAMLDAWAMVWQPDWPAAWLILALLTAQRAGELMHAERNTRALLAAGAREYGRGHYPAMVAIHAAFLAALWLTVPSDAPIIWPLAIAVVLLQAARLWVLATLGRYWTTRIISAPGLPRIARGPYRWVRHPNYVVVTLEIACIPLMFGALSIAIVFSLLNALILTVRIGTENRALAERQSVFQSGGGA